MQDNIPIYEGDLFTVIENGIKIGPSGIVIKDYLNFSDVDIFWLDTATIENHTKYWLRTYCVKEEV